MRLPPAKRKPDTLEKVLSEAVYSEIPVSIVQHCQAVPLGVMVRGTLEWLLDEPIMEMLFAQNASELYTRELTIANLVGLFIEVSTGARRSVYAAYKADQASTDPTIDTSAQALYGKLGRLPPAVSEAVVRYSAERCGELLEFSPPARDQPLPGYRMRVLDGNVLAGTNHRLKALRRWLNACLPGKSLVVYEPGTGLVTDLVLCEDAYTQERALLIHVLERLRQRDLIVADRNFCTLRFVMGVRARSAFFIVRQHAVNVPTRTVTRLKPCGTTATGAVSEQSVQINDPDTGQAILLRRIQVRLIDKTRDGERTITLLTNLPSEVSAVAIAELYRQRWTIEKYFQFLTQSLHCEVSGLGQPRAALFAFAMALVAGNALAVVRGGLRWAHGVEAEREVSGYYLADEVASDYRTLMKYLPAEQWRGWRDLPVPAMARLLRAVAQHVNLKGLSRSPRGPKKPPQEKPVYDKNHKHYSTARLLNNLEQEDSS
jgi:Transposase DDE domain